MALSVSSPAFKEGQNIPARYTADGQNVSPQLDWRGVPTQTSSLALILHDPDAPRPGGFTHWVIFNMPADSRGLAEKITGKERLENGAVQRRNDGGGTGYMGPSPPSGKPHHYHFRLYALDQLLKLTGATGRPQLEDAVKGHVLAETELIGLYQR